ncbi:MAG TPA: winged helix-turn-helix domain-containing tetratricopeptide repeat protein [Reyranella sp.]|nr:winged helix-turn-helix domain-containing tetratricopeptide repeat protein [Reyranella sp.]
MRYLFEDCALDIDRRELHRGPKPVSLEPQVFDLLVHLIRHRDRVVSKDDLLDTVWKGRAVSESALFNRINAARKAIGDTGDRQRLIKTLPRKGLRFVGEVREEAQRSLSLPDLPLPDRPSIAVLPFADTSGDPGREYFADGISEDLVTGLARIRWLFVIARNSTFVYKHRAVDAKQVSRELGVRYILEGSVRRAGNRLRITAQLIDATTGGHLWAERYERELGDIFAVQDDITRSVAAAIEPRLLAAEGIRALSRSPQHLGAWELVAQAQTHFWRMSRADHEAAIEPLRKAIEAHPDYAPARGRLGFCLVFAAHMGWVGGERGLLAGREHAIRAIALDDCDPWGHIALGYWAMMERRTEESIAAFRQAVRLNPNSAAAHSHLSRGFAFAGRDGEAIEHGNEAIRLSPLDPERALFLGAIAVAHYTAGRYDQAAHFTAEALRLRPGFQGAQRLRCASLARAGRVEEARAFLAEVRRDQPRLSLEWVRGNVPYQTRELMDQFVEGLRLAGLR